LTHADRLNAELPTGRAEEDAAKDEPAASNAALLELEYRSGT
jgi:hypothetical protein